MNIRKLTKKLIPSRLFSVIEPYGHLTEAVVAQIKYKFPAKGMNIIGVTGTDGKTTTCSLIASVLRAGGLKVAVITTAFIDYGDGKGAQPNPTKLTTGNTFLLNKLISEIKENNIDWLIIEVSSHALNQRRVWNIPFSIAVLTNMSPEHLDYHKTFDNYRKAKELLFKQCSKNKKGKQIGIINADDKTAKYFINDIKNPITYGLNKADFLAKNVNSTIPGSDFDLSLNNKLHTFHIKLIGDFNIYNALAAVAVGDSIGLDVKAIKKGLDSIPLVKGRMMPIDEGQDFNILIDYAVTPFALENVLKTVRSLITKPAKIHIVFGATGNRDKTKRPAMGKVTSTLADFIYLTDDETYTEDGASIRKAVLDGISNKNLRKVIEIESRRDAIKKAFDNAKKGDIVLITGIGHQDSINMGGKNLKWSDIEEAKKAIKEKLTS